MERDPTENHVPDFARVNLLLHFQNSNAIAKRRITRGRLAVSIDAESLSKAMIL